MYIFYKNKPTDKIWWCDRVDDSTQSIYIGEHWFSFDKKIIYNLFRDYPYSLSSEQKQVFDEENPFWRDFFKGRV